MPLTKDEILNYDDLKVKRIKVPAWDNAEVCIKPLTRGQCDIYLNRLYGKVEMTLTAGSPRVGSQKGDPYGHDAYLCVCGICDENGESLFTTKELSKLEAKFGLAIGQIAVEIAKISGLVVDQDALERLENAKN
jgi:hypothetical protein